MKAINADKVLDKETGIDSSYLDLAENIAKNYCRTYELNSSYSLIYYSEGVVGVKWKTKIIMFKVIQDGEVSDALFIAALQDIRIRIREGINDDLQSRVSNSNNIE